MRYIHAEYHPAPCRLPVPSDSYTPCTFENDDDKDKELLNQSYIVPYHTQLQRPKNYCHIAYNSH